VVNEYSEPGKKPAGSCGSKPIRQWQSSQTRRNIFCKHRAKMAVWTRI